MLHILKADTLGSDVVALGGDYEILYEKLLRAGGYSGKATHYETRFKNEYPSSLEAGDVVLVSGSKLDAWADNEWTTDLIEFLRSAIATEGVRLIGICYGHQIIARALGAPVGRTPKWELGASELTLTETGKEVFAEIKDGDRLEQVHLDQVFELPDDATLLASTASCPIQAFWKRGKYICIQGHPEFGESVAKLCMLKVKSTDPEAYEEGFYRAGLPHTGLAFGYALARFAE